MIQTEFGRGSGLYIPVVVGGTVDAVEVPSGAPALAEWQAAGVRRGRCRGCLGGGAGRRRGGWGGHRGHAAGTGRVRVQRACWLVVHHSSETNTLIIVCRGKSCWRVGLKFKHSNSVVPILSLLQTYLASSSCCSKTLPQNSFLQLSECLPAL